MQHEKLINNLWTKSVFFAPIIHLCMSICLGAMLLSITVLNSKISHNMPHYGDISDFNFLIESKLYILCSMKG